MRFYFVLKRVFFDLFKNLLFNDDDDDKEIRVFFSFIIN